MLRSLWKKIDRENNKYLINEEAAAKNVQKTKRRFIKKQSKMFNNYFTSIILLFVRIKQRSRKKNYN